MTSDITYNRCSGLFDHIWSSIQIHRAITTSFVLLWSVIKLLEGDSDV